MTVLKSVVPRNIGARDESSHGLRKEAIAGIAIAASAICVAVICVICLLVRAIRKRKRDNWALHQTDPEMRRRTTREISIAGPNVSRPRKVLSRNNLLPYNNDPGWDSLASRDTMDQAPKTRSRPKNSMPNFSKVMRPQKAWTRKGEHLASLPLTKLSSLRISRSSPKRPWNKMKSQLSLSARNPHEDTDNSADTREETDKDDPTAINFDTPSMQDLTALIGKENMKNLKPQPLFSGTPKQSARAVRSKTIGSGADLSSSLHGTAHSRINKIRPSIHSRSISLGGYQPCPAPNIPVPPLPLIQKIDRAKSVARRVIEQSSSRHSDSSLESVGSSLLGLRGSPNLQRNNTLPLGLPVDNARQRSFANWGDRPQETTMSNTFSDYKFPNRPKPSRHMSDGGMLQQITRANTISSLQGKSKPMYRMSASDIMVAHRISAISSQSHQNAGYIPHSSSTPTRYSRSRTTIYGSPCERRKTSHVRNPSQCNITPIRHPSLSSLRAPSSRSSNGNPFQWDKSPLQSGKPSAMKGSPGARKGQKRQNSVRISLAPTILGPCSQSPTSSVMNDIREESSEQGSMDEMSSLKVFDDQTDRALPQPPSTSTFSPQVNMEVKSLEASLADNSPTLSLVDFCEELPSTSSKRTPLSEISSPQLPGSPSSRNSSFFSILESPEAPINIALSEPIQNGNSSHFLGTENNDENTPPSARLERMLSYEQSYVSDEKAYGIQTSDPPMEPMSHSESREALHSSEDLTEKDIMKDSSSPLLYLPGLKQSRNTKVTSCKTNRKSPPQPRSQELVKPENQIHLRDHSCSGTCHQNLHQIALRATPKIPPKSCSAIESYFEPPHSVHKSIIALRRMDSDISITSSHTDRYHLQFGMETSPPASPSSVDKYKEEWGDFQSSYEPKMDETARKEIEERRSRVWEEGDKFWKTNDDSQKGTKSNPKIPGLNIVPPSTQGTPASLYDRDGFLK